MSNEPQVRFRTVQRGIQVEVGLDLSEHIINHYGRLLYHRVVGVRFEEMDGESLPVLLFHDGTASSRLTTLSAIVYRDPEGNGPGHLEILPLQ